MNTNETALLDELVPRVDEPADWDDVLRRARRTGTRRRRLLAATLVAASLAGASVAAVLATRDARAGLPAGADRSNVVVVVQPLTGRVVVQAAPWKGHDGVCYTLLWKHAGCVPRTTRGTVVLSPPLAGWTFDRRVVSGTALTSHGRVPLLVSRFGGRLAVTFFVMRDRLPRAVREVVLRDAQARVVARVHVR